MGPYMILPPKLQELEYSGANDIRQELMIGLRLDRLALVAIGLRRPISSFSVLA